MATSKFKFNLEITGFKMEIEGTKEDVASISASIGSQLGNLMKPKGIEMQPPQITEDGEAEVVQIGSSKKGRINRKRQTGTAKPGATIVPDFSGNPVRYGTPNQHWTGYEKAMWIMYVMKQEKVINELSAGQIAIIFNKHFQQAKTIKPNHVSKDLGNKKLNKGDQKALVGDNQSVNPTTWYLLEEGEKFIQRLIAKQLGENGTGREDTAD